jgi:hypothetical protein
MPIFADIYAVFLALVAIVSAWQNAQDERPLWFTGLEFGADFILLLLFCAYWIPSLARVAGSAAALLFLFSLGWFLCWLPHKLARFQEEELPAHLNLRQKRAVFAAIAGSAFPAYWFGGIVAFRSI